MDSFGRIRIEDSRDEGYPLSLAVPAEVPGVDYRYWNDIQWWGDQGPHPHCVAYAWMHWVEDGPVTHKAVPAPALDPVQVYNRAQVLDQWPGENYDGTSVRAGAKVLQEHGFLSQYLWAWEVDVVARAILSTGPVVVGTNWYQGMSSPDSNYLLRPTGSLLGGHAYVLNGVNVRKGLFRMKNSWGRNWGKWGRGYITFADFQTLLDQDGDACMAVEVSSG